MRDVVEQAQSALNAFLTHMGMDEDEWTQPTFNQARAAVKSCEAALAAPPTAGAEREGWQLMPTTPTQEMCQAGQWKANEWQRFPLRISPIYKAMLEAAPSAPSDQQGGRT